ncbi:EF-P 5-aminopentanol modification-associated protein YfmH [Fundicoccus sp. Sow4_D5]|uniref:EF-P 5-aminopentanol modification-associated protein YfmH n=1 Tax=unclassified Fundicoccus TaxID=2761543 RepID=UPI003F914F78
MHKQFFKDVDETMIQTKLKNGLSVTLIPKEDYHRVYGILTTNFGSLDVAIENVQTGEVIPIPAGAAHFLEHKMFEGQNGEDAFVKFMRQGAQANAFTTNFQTSYLFSTSFQIEKNIETLLDFVQTPYFTKDGIEKEKGIIEQEIISYLDSPHWRIHQLLLEGLYPNHPAAIDIAGSVASVNATTYADLTNAYNAFYHPSRMSLILVGNISPEKVIPLIEVNQSKKKFPELVYQSKPVLLESSVVDKQTVRMEVSQPLVALGARLGEINASNDQLHRLTLQSAVLIDLLFGPTASVSQAWYEKKWIDNSFDWMISSKNPMHYLYLSVSTDYPQDILLEWENVLKDWENSFDLNQIHFEQVIKGRIGDLLQMHNSLENIAYAIIESEFDDYEYFNTLKYLKDMTLSDVIAYGKKYWTTAELSRAVILPIA